MSWVAVSTVGGQAITGALGGALGGGGGAPAGPNISGDIKGGAFTFGPQNRGIPVWAIVSALGLAVLGFVAWLAFGNRKK